MDQPGYIPLSARPRQFSAGQSAGQKRKWREASSSSSYDGPILAMQESRIGFPQPLPKLPVTVRPIMGDKDQLEIWKLCQETTVEIISEEGLAFDEVALYSRKGAGDMHFSPSLLISLKTIFEEHSAKNALITIGYMLHELGVKNLQVEMANPMAYQQKSVFPVSHDHPLVTLWPHHIRDMVLRELENVPFSELGVYSYGFSIEARATITITVENESVDVQEDLRSAIIGICESHGISEMHVAFIIDQAKLGGPPVTAQDEVDDGFFEGMQSYAERPGMGHSIGVGDNDAGTLGGYLCLVDHSKNIRKMVFLTCWHVLRPGDGSNKLPCEC